MTADLIAFLRARLDEEAAAAAEALKMKFDLPSDAPWERYRLMTERGFHLSPADRHYARHDPARVLREVEAKRRIVVRYEDQAALLANHMGGILTKYLVQELLEVARLLALPYDDHPDFKETWRP